MHHTFFWPPAVLARVIERKILKGRSEVEFDLSKKNHFLLLPGMGGPAFHLFNLVHALRKTPSFSSYGVTVVKLGLSVGDFSETLEMVTSELEAALLSKKIVKKVVFFGYSHGGRFAAQLAVDLQRKYPDLKIVIITAGTPLIKRPNSGRNWLLSLAFRTWPSITQPTKKNFYSFYSPDDLIVTPMYATSGSKAKLIELKGFGHNDFRVPEKIIPELKKLLTKV